MENEPDPAEGGAPASTTADALGTIDEVRALLEAATHHDLADRAAAVKQKLDAAHQALEAVQRDRGGALGQALLGVEQGLRDEIEELEQRIRENPLGALLAAGALGLLLGFFLTRHRH